MPPVSWTSSATEPNARWTPACRRTGSSTPGRPSVSWSGPLLRLGAMGANLGTDTAITLFAAGLIFLAALILGAWKYRQMATSTDHLAHPYVDIAHRAALL